MLCRFFQRLSAKVRPALGSIFNKRGIKCTYFEFHSCMEQTIGGTIYTLRVSPTTELKVLSLQ